MNRLQCQQLFSEISSRHRQTRVAESIPRLSCSMYESLCESCTIMAHGVAISGHHHSSRNSGLASKKEYFYTLTYHSGRSTGPIPTCRGISCPLTGIPVEGKRNNGMSRIQRNTSFFPSRLLLPVRDSCIHGDDRQNRCQLTGLEIDFKGLMLIGLKNPFHNV